MIVKNEEAVLQRCLDSVADLMDEIIIVDTGSTDATKEIAGRYTKHVYDFSWRDDFAAARNYAFSKATMEYVYSADADEVLDPLNHDRFARLKEALLPEIELVQMKYMTPEGMSPVMNTVREYRPKLFRRLRTFTWVDPIHETVRLTPVVYDSDIEIMHLPMARHESRDFRFFRQAYERDGFLSENMLAMYARELFLVGTDQDFLDAAQIMDHAFRELHEEELLRKMACVLIRIRRITGDISEFFALSLMDIVSIPSAEVCCEIGEYFYSEKKYPMALEWFHNAAEETSAILDIHAGGDRPLFRMADCCDRMAEEALSLEQGYESVAESYHARAEGYRAAAESWTMPED